MRHTPAALLLVLCGLPGWGARTVEMAVDAGLPAPARHGLRTLEQALRAKGLDVSNSGADFVVVAGLDKSLGTAEALSIRRGEHRGKPAVFLRGADARGLMYAALDTAERVSWASGADPFAQVRDTSEKPYVAERGVSIYTMQRAYFESRLYDQEYWKHYFDMLAANRFNNFVVIFGYENGGFMAPLYPYFFDVAEFPDVRLVGITRAEQERNTAAFRALIRLAHERGIDVTAGIWDHIYRGGVQGGGIAGASDNAGKRVPGLVWGVTAANLAPYTKAALRQFLAVFPDIDAIQFRMHDESGLKREEMQGFWHDVFTFIRQVKPDLRLDLRAKDLPDAVINDALDQGLRARVSTKYWMEQMGLPFHLTHVYKENQGDRRHGYADLLKYPQRYRVHWQLWTGGTLRLLQWGDPEYVRRFAETVRLYDGNSFDVNEMLATKMLGEAHDRSPVPILDAKYRYYDHEFERYWNFYRLFGRLTYDPGVPAELWEREYTRRFGAAGAELMGGVQAASKVLPRIVAASYRYFYFPTTRGWPEMFRQDSLPVFATEENSDTQQFLSASDEARSILAGTDTAMRRPEQTSRWFERTADTIDGKIALAGKAIGERRNAEFTSTVADLKILAGLARYYAWRLRAAVDYNLYRQAGDAASFDRAIANEKRAIEAYGSIVAAAGDIYSHDLPFGPPGRGYARHWDEEFHALQRDFGKLTVERQKFSQQADAKPVRVPERRDDQPPVARLEAAPVAMPGQDVAIAAKISAPAGVKWVRLRYRHLTQFEDYQTAEMTEAGAGRYVGRIPASFIDPKWDLMYFVEVGDKTGAGRMYPDLDVETPYVIVKVKR